MQKYDDFQKMINSVENRKQAAQNAVSDIKQRLGALLAANDAAQITGGHVDAQGMEALRRQLDDAQTALKAFDKEPRQIVGLLRGVDQVVALAREVVEESNEAIEKLQASSDKKLATLKKQREEFLNTVRELGEIQNKADTITRRAVACAMYIPAPQRPHCLSVASGIYLASEIGDIFINPKTTRDVFTGRV